MLPRRKRKLICGSLGQRVIALDGSHASLTSKPDKVTALNDEAANAAWAQGTSSCRIACSFCPMQARRLDRLVVGPSAHRRRHIVRTTRNSALPLIIRE